MPTGYHPCNTVCPHELNGAPSPGFLANAAKAVFYSPARRTPVARPYWHWPHGACARAQESGCYGVAISLRSRNLLATSAAREPCHSACCVPALSPCPGWIPSENRGAGWYVYTQRRGYTCISRCIIMNSGSSAPRPVYAGPAERKHEGLRHAKNCLEPGRFASGGTGTCWQLGARR